MCGIVFVLQFEHGSTNSDSEVKHSSNSSETVDKTNDLSLLPIDISNLNQSNARRGPDVSGYHFEILQQGDKKITLNFWGHVLFLRGNKPTKQPLVVKEDVLLWNAEVFGGLQVNIDENDGLLVLEQLSKASTEIEILSIIGSLEGPHGFVFYKASLQKIFFGRDRLGIRSLLSTSSESNNTSWLTLASVGHQENDTTTDWKELETRFLFSIDLKAMLCFTDSTLSTSITPLLRPNTAVDPVLDLPDYLVISQELKGNLDPLTPVKADFSTIFSAYISNPIFSETIHKLESLLSQAVSKRVVSIPKTTRFEDSRLAILFSGGIDCTILALLAHRYIPPEEPIDLLNVSFENPRIAAANASKGLPPPPAPDRTTGLSGLAELIRLCPGRQFRFVTIDVSYSEATEARPHIQSLLKPSCTEMDLSIAMAFWFAARGSGLVDGNPFQSQAKVLLSGLGADEQLAGYTRHRAVFEKGGWSALIKEVQLDVGRISLRNLGRDDRMVGDRGREVRYPYLDCQMVAFLSSLPLPLKTNLAYPRGVGEKLLLRLLARHLGFDTVAGLPKRAIQFGARTAKMSLGSSSKLGHHVLE